jgi:hypothetical protein
MEFLENLERHRPLRQETLVSVRLANQGGTSTASGLASSPRILIAAIGYLGER